MGKSKSIQELDQTNVEYRNYLKTITDELAASARSQTDQLTKYINDFYEENDWKSVRFIAGKNVDFMHTSDWSLDRMTDVIKTVASSLFGGTGKLEDVDIDTSSMEVSAALAAMANLEVYLVLQVFKALAGVIESFGSSTSVSYKESYKSEPLGGGFHLFAVMACNSYKADQFPNKETILEYLYVYEIRFSTGEAAKSGQMTVVQALLNQLDAINEKIDKLLKQWKDDKITERQYKKFLSGYTALQDAVTKRLNDLSKDEGFTLVSIPPVVPE
jgi:hypothetical protein